MALAEQQLRDGTASAQVISHFLKAGSTRERLEQQRIAQENQFLGAKIGALADARNSEEMYGRALNAMRRYSGQDPEPGTESYDQHQQT